MHQGWGGGGKKAMRTGGIYSINAGENDSLDYSADSRNEEKRKSVRTCYWLLGCWILVKG